MGTTKRHVSTIDEATFAKASERGRRLLARGPLATAARYEAGRIHVELNNGCAFEFPVAHAEGLAGAKVTDLRAIEVSASGLGLHWPKLDADLYVPALVKGNLGHQAVDDADWIAGGKGGECCKGRRCPCQWQARRPTAQAPGAGNRVARRSGSKSSTNRIGVCRFAGCPEIGPSALGRLDRDGECLVATHRGHSCDANRCSKVDGKNRRSVS